MGVKDAKCVLTGLDLEQYRESVRFKNRGFADSKILSETGLIHWMGNGWDLTPYANDLIFHYEVAGGTYHKEPDIEWNDVMFLIGKQASCGNIIKIGFFDSQISRLDKLGILSLFNTDEFSDSYFITSKGIEIINRYYKYNSDARHKELISDAMTLIKSCVETCEGFNCECGCFVGAINFLASSGMSHKNVAINIHNWIATLLDDCNSELDLV